MMHGSTVTYSVQSFRYLPPSVEDAAVRACISACAVGSESVSTRLWPRPMTAPRATLAVTALGQTREIVFATDCFRRLDFTAGEAAAAGTLAIGPEVVAVDLERTPDFAFVCRQTQADGSLREVVPTWSATLSNGRAVSLTPEGRIVCPTGGFASATLAPAAWGTPTAASRFFRVSVDLE